MSALSRKMRVVVADDDLDELHLLQRKLKLALPQSVEFQLFSEADEAAEYFRCGGTATIAVFDFHFQGQALNGRHLVEAARNRAMAVFLHTGGGASYQEEDYAAATRLADRVFLKRGSGFYGLPGLPTTADLVVAVSQLLAPPPDPRMQILHLPGLK